MKKPLVTLLLAAGFITTTSANSLDCTNNNSNQCCIDYASMVNAISQSSTQSITTTDKHNLVSLDDNLTNDGTDNRPCEDQASYIDATGPGEATFLWLQGDWADTISMLKGSSSAK